MADKGSHPQRRPPEAAISQQEQRRHDGPDSAQAGLHDAIVDTRGASAGAEAPRPKVGHEQERRGEDAAASSTAEFFQRLSELATEHLEDDADFELDGLDEEHELIGPTQPNPARGSRGGAAAGRRGQPSRPTGPLRKGRGDEADPADAAAASPAVSAEPTPSPAVRVRPAKRAVSIELDDLLRYGIEMGLLDEYQKSCIEKLLVKLGWDEFDDLQQAVDSCANAVQRILVLAALSAHRAPAWLPAFAAELSGHSEEALLRLCSRSHDADLPGEAADIEALRLRYDPMSHFDLGVAAPHGLDAADVWTVPKWLRGVPSPAIAMAALAFEQNLRAEFHPSQERAEGANDLLTRALEVHGSVHPALERWLLSLCARAQSRRALVSARDALLKARTQGVSLGSTG